MTVKNENAEILRDHMNTILGKIMCISGCYQDLVEDKDADNAIFNINLHLIDLYEAAVAALNVIDNIDTPPLLN